MHIPYVACYSTAVMRRNIRACGNDEEQSVLYHMAGNNAYLRDNIGFAFAAPAELAASIVETGKAQLSELKTVSSKE